MLLLNILFWFFCKIQKLELPWLKYSKNIRYKQKVNYEGWVVFQGKHGVNTII